MYAREINGREFTFGVSGKLIRNVLVMYDRQTGSYWSQLLGEAVDGEMVGTKLQFLPSWMTTWTQWKEMYPDTMALNKRGRRGSRDSYDFYYTSSAAGVIGETIDDGRLYTKEFVIGVELGETKIAYPFSMLSAEPVVNDVIGDNSVLVVFDKATAAAVAYSRLVDGQVLTFAVAGSPFVLVDEETASTWDAFSGVALSGPLAGEQLSRVKSTTAFWFGWKDTHPGTLVYGVDE